MPIFSTYNDGDDNDNVDDDDDNFVVVVVVIICFYVELVCLVGLLKAKNISNNKQPQLQAGRQIYIVLHGAASNNCC